MTGKQTIMQFIIEISVYLSYFKVNFAVIGSRSSSVEGYSLHQRKAIEETVLKSMERIFPPIQICINKTRYSSIQTTILQDSITIMSVVSRVQPICGTSRRAKTCAVKILYFQWRFFIGGPSGLSLQDILETYINKKTDALSSPI